MNAFLEWLRNVGALNAWDLQRALRPVAEAVQATVLEHRRTIERAGGGAVIALAEAALVEYNKVAERPLPL